MENYHQTYTINSEYVNEGTLDQDCLEYLSNTPCFKDQLLNTFVPLKTTGDGNCLLHAISICIWGQELFDKMLRGNLVSELVDNEDFYKQYCHKIDKKEWDIIILEARADTAMLRLLHIFALSNVLKRPIILIASQEDKEKFGEGEQSATATFLPTRSDPTDCIKRPLFISWSSSYRNHFVAIVPLNNHVIELPIPEIAFPKSLKCSLDDFLSLEEAIAPCFVYIKSIGKIDVVLNFKNKHNKGIVFRKKTKITKLRKHIKNYLFKHGVYFNEATLDRIVAEVNSWPMDPILKKDQLDSILVMIKKIYVSNPVFEVPQEVIDKVSYLANPSSDFESAKEDLLILLSQFIEKTPGLSYAIIDYCATLAQVHNISSVFKLITNLIFKAFINSDSWKVDVASLKYMTSILQPKYANLVQKEFKAMTYLLTVKLLKILEGTETRYYKYYAQISHNITILNTRPADFFIISMSHVLSSPAFNLLKEPDQLLFIQSLDRIYDKFRIFHDDMSFRRSLFHILNSSPNEHIKISVLMFLTRFYEKDEMKTQRDKTKLDLSLLMMSNQLFDHSMLINDSI